MKTIYTLILGLLILFNISCQKDKVKPITKSPIDTTTIPIDTTRHKISVESTQISHTSIFINGVEFGSWSQFGFPIPDLGMGGCYCTCGSCVVFWTEPGDLVTIETNPLEADGYWDVSSGDSIFYGAMTVLIVYIDSLPFSNYPEDGYYPEQVYYNKAQGNQQWTKQF